MSFLQLLQSNETLLLVTVTVIGLAVGSFLNVVIYRLPLMMKRTWRSECCEFLEIENKAGEESENFNLLKPASHCPHCNHRITALQNIPVLSYLLLRGKCSNCGAAISIRYPSIEILTGAMSFIITLYFGYGTQLIPLLILTWSLIALSFIDIDHQLLPDDITLPVMWLGILCNMFAVFTDIYASVAGAMLGYMSLWSIYILFKLVTGKEGMGHGDFKLLALLGAWMGWQSLPMIVILSSVCGAIVGSGMIIFRGHDRQTAIPFGPYLAMAGWITLVWGEQITGAYNSWFMVP